VLTNGSPESILPLCKAIRNEDVERRILAAVDSLAVKGLRVLAFARREIDDGLPETAATAETDMDLLGLVGMAPFVAWALSAGTIPLMISVLQVLALDIGTDLLPALALGAERPEPGIMERPPRARTAKLLDRAVLGRAFGFLGPVEAALAMAMLPIGAAVFSGWHGDQLPASGPMIETLAAFVHVPPIAALLEQGPLALAHWLPILLAPSCSSPPKRPARWWSAGGGRVSEV
jgi:magnesium-transporting ATPase (P-type)